MSTIDRNKLLESGTKNIEKLNNEIETLNGFGFETSLVTGYGEGVFVVTVRLKHKESNITALVAIPQCEKDGEQGHVKLEPLRDLPSFLQGFYSF